MGIVWLKKAGGLFPDVPKIMSKLCSPHDGDDPKTRHQAGLGKRCSPHDGDDPRLYDSVMRKIAMFPA